MRLEHVLFSHCRSRADKTALVCGSERISYGELGDRIRAVASGLVGLGLGMGDRVILYVSNSIAFVEGFYGVLAAGGIPITVTARLSLREIAFFCDDASAFAIMCEGERAAEVKAEVLATRPGVRLITIGDGPDGSVRLDSLRRTQHAPLPEVPVTQDEALIMYTSGTTGTPKGAILTHANVLIQHGFMNCTEWGVSGEDRYLVVAPMAHRSGLGRLINATMLGGTLHICAQFDPPVLLDIIEREKITVFGLVPTMCRMIMPELEAAPHKAASIRIMTVTGEAFPVSLKQRLIELMPEVRLVSFFGMTEAGGITTLTHQEQFTHADSVGRASPGLEIRVIDETGADAAPGEVGELLVRAGRPGAFTVLKGYLGRPEQTAEALRGGWFHTGDLVRIDADGYIYIVDRKKDMVLSGGFNVYSKEVELTILDLPGVSDVVVIGLPDPVYGEAVTAVIEPDPDHSPPSVDDIIARCRATIASYKKPRHVFYRDELPRNATGKVRKHELLADILREIGAAPDGVGE